MAHASAPRTQDRRADPPRRLNGLDAARALAIIGMLAVNVGPRKEDDQTALAVLLYDLPHGRASILFMILAGIGMSLMTRKARLYGAAMPWKTIIWRAALLIVGGLALQLLEHDISVILTYYGVLFMCGLPLLRAPTWLVSIIGLVSLIAGPLIWLGLQQYSSTTFDFLAPSLSDPGWTMVHATLLTGAYPLVVWLAPFCFGLVLGRGRLADRDVQYQLIGWGLAAMIVPIGQSMTLIAFLGEPAASYGWDQLRLVEPHSQMPLWLISSSGSAVVIIGLLLRGTSWVVTRLSWLVSAGRLSLTIYVAHLFVLAWLVRPGPDSLLEGVIVSAIMSIGFVLAAHLWWRSLGTGPLERLLSWPPNLLHSGRSNARPTDR